MTKRISAIFDTNHSNLELGVFTIIASMHCLSQPLMLLLLLVLGQNQWVKLQDITLHCFQDTSMHVSVSPHASSLPNVSPSMPPSTFMCCGGRHYSLKTSGIDGNAAKCHLLTGECGCNTAMLATQILFGLSLSHRVVTSPCSICRTFTLASLLLL